MNYLLKNALVITGDKQCTVLPETDIFVKNGKIEAVGQNLKTESENSSVKVIDLSGKMVIPGLINGHSHSYANLVKGMGDLLPLEPWMYYAMLLGRFTLDEIRIASLLQVIECLRNGCTAFIDHLGREYEALDTAMATFADSGIRANIAPMISDKSYDQGLPFRDGDLSIEDHTYFALVKKPRSSAEILVECEELINKWHGYGGVLGVLIGPSGPQRCSDKLLCDCMELAKKYNVGFHTHLLETRIQAEAGNLFYGKPMVEHLAKLGILSPRVSLAHAIWVTDKEISLIAEHGASIVHNPISNLTLGSGIAPIMKYREAGVNIALGTDGSNCGGSQSVFMSMHLAAVLPRVSTPVYEKWPTASEVLQMATIGGARILLAEDELGSLTLGKAADIVVLDLKQSTYQPLNDPIQQLVYGEKGKGVETVMVNGKILLQEGRLTTVDEGMVLDEARKLATSLAAKKTSWIEMTKRQYNFVEQLYKKHWFS